MIFGDVTIQDCQREALLESQITLFQRKINRLCKQISFKEEIAQGLLTPWFCEHYDNEIETRYQEMAQLEGAVRAAQLELDRLADKRYADKARRLAALALIEEVGKKATDPAAGKTPASAPPSDPRQKQQDMFFGPGAPPAAPPSHSPSVTIDQKAEDDIALALEICRREIPPPTPPTAAASTPAASTNAAPLTRPTLSRTVTAPGAEGQAAMAMGDAVPAEQGEGEEESAPADVPSTETAAASATADANAANGPAKQSSSGGQESERERADQAE